MKDRIIRYFKENQLYFMAGAAMLSGNTYAACRYVLPAMREMMNKDQ